MGQECSWKRGSGSDYGNACGAHSTLLIEFVPRPGPRSSCLPLLVMKSLAVIKLTLPAKAVWSEAKLRPRPLRLRVQPPRLGPRVTCLILSQKQFVARCCNVRLGDSFRWQRFPSLWQIFQRLIKVCHGPRPIAIPYYFLPFRPPYAQSPSGARITVLDAKWKLKLDAVTCEKLRVCHLFMNCSLVKLSHTHCDTHMHTHTHRSHPISILN